MARQRALLGVACAGQPPHHTEHFPLLILHDRMRSNDTSILFRCYSKIVLRHAQTDAFVLGRLSMGGMVRDTVDAFDGNADAPTLEVKY